MTFGLGSACGSPPGVRPGGRPTFFASPKKVGKERRPAFRALRVPELGLGPAGKKGTRPHCVRNSDNFFSLSAGPIPSSALNTGKSNSHTARFASPIGGCRAAAPHRGDAQRAELCSPWAAPSNAANRGRSGTPRQPDLSESLYPGASCPAAPGLRVAQGTPVLRGAAVGSPFFDYFLWRSKESNSAAGPKPRRAATQRRTKLTEATP
jgi:hypothetical protein